MIANVNRNPKTRPLRAEDFHPLRKRERSTLKRKDIADMQPVIAAIRRDMQRNGRHS
ncbi:MAG: hypothetical protein AAF958_14225 [Planctomycetota bacterium]